MKTAIQTGEGGAFTNSFLRSGANNRTIRIKISLKSILTHDENDSEFYSFTLFSLHISARTFGNTHNQDVRATCRTVTDRQSSKPEKGI